MNTNNLEILCEVATQAHTRIQQDFKDINPMVSVNRKMRDMGVPVDAMTIDCLKSGKRILLILHDQQPDTVSYQFAYKDKDPDQKFEHIPLSELSDSKLYGWIKDYFQANSSNPETE